MADKFDDIEHCEIADSDWNKLLKDTILVRPIVTDGDTVLVLEEQKYKYIFDNLRSGSKISVDTYIFDKFASYVVFKIKDLKFVLAIEESTHEIMNILSREKFSFCLNEEEYARKGGRRKYNRWFKLSPKDRKVIYASILIVADKNKKIKKLEENNNG